MKIAVCTKDSTNGALSDRFARSDFFAIYDTNTTEFNVIENQAKFASGGASAQAVLILSKENVDVVLCTRVGPKALEALYEFEIQAYNFNTASNVESAIRLFQENELPLITTAHNKKLK